MMEVADKLNAVIVDEDDHNHNHLLPSDLMNPSWANSSSTGKKKSLLGWLTSKLKQYL